MANDTFFRSIYPVIAGMIVLFCVTTQAAWYDSNWQYRQQITISSAITPGDLSNYPVLISITTATNSLFANAQTDGDDIVFTAADGATRLPHEIDFFNAISGQERLAAWVGIPFLSASTNTIIYMYYGNPAAANQENSSAVWDSNFMMVQHLQETSGTHYDSTTHANHGQPQGSLNQNASGIIAGADSFDGSDDYIALSGTFGGTSWNQVTIEAWVYVSTTMPDFQAMVSSTGGGFGHFQLNSGGNIALYVDGSSWIPLPIISQTPTGTWRYMVMSCQSGDSRVFDNTTQVGATMTNGFTYVNPAADMRIGSGHAGARWFNGIIDEVRISNVARSQNWITATYRNTSAPTTYLTFLTEETPTPTPTLTPTRTPTFTPTPLPPTFTPRPTNTPTPTRTPTNTPTDTPTETPTPTNTPTDTPTETPTPTNTPTDTPTETPTPTNTPTDTPTETPTPTNTPTDTPTETPTPTNTPTDTPTQTPTPTNTPTDTPTQTPTPTNTPTDTPTQTPTPTNTPTDTPTLTPIPTETPIPTVTPTPTPVCTHTGDANLDGVISSGDAQQAFYFALGATIPTPIEACAADCNGDGILSAGDAQSIFYAALGSGSCVDPI